MPRAVRKQIPDAKPLPEPEHRGKRRECAIGTLSLLDAMRTQATKDDNVAARVEIRARLPDWHGAVAHVSGTLVLAYGIQGLSSAGARAIVEQLRLIAADIERLT